MWEIIWNLGSDMVVSENKELNEFVTKFGVIRDADIDAFDKIANTVFGISVKWEENSDSDADVFPLKAIVNSVPWKLRINDFPEEPMYTLFIEDEAIITFDDRPDTWVVKGVNSRY